MGISAANVKQVVNQVFPVLDSLKPSKIASYALDLLKGVFGEIGSKLIGMVAAVFDNPVTRAVDRLFSIQFDTKPAVVHTSPRFTQPPLGTKESMDGLERSFSISQIDHGIRKYYISGAPMFTEETLENVRQTLEQEKRLDGHSDASDWYLDIFNAKFDTVSSSVDKAENRMNQKNLELSAFDVGNSELDKEDSATLQQIKESFNASIEKMQTAKTRDEFFMRTVKLKEEVASLRYDVEHLEDGPLKSTMERALENLDHTLNNKEERLKVLYSSDEYSTKRKEFTARLTQLRAENVEEEIGHFDEKYAQQGEAYLIRIEGKCDRLEQMAIEVGYQHEVLKGRLTHLRGQVEEARKPKPERLSLEDRKE